MNNSVAEIQEYLDSKDPDLIQTAIRDLRERMNKGNEFGVKFFGQEILEPFGEKVPEETQLDLISVLKGYRLFFPEISQLVRIDAMMKVVFRYAVHYIAFSAALELKITNTPASAVKTAMGSIARQRLLSATNISCASYFVNCLLDGKDEVREAALESLRKWPLESSYQEVIELIKPRLTQTELERFSVE